MEKLSTSRRAKCRFSTLYSPWYNETIESVSKEIIRLLHAFNSETSTPQDGWLDSLPFFQIIIINSPSRIFKYNAPITLHTVILS